jgi:4'-phosphopantetheinyl transferase
MSAPTEWPPTTERPELQSDAVHVWRATLAVDAATLQSLGQSLSDDERARAERFIFQQDRDQFTAARGILRDLLGRYLRCHPKGIAFSYGLRGKPAVFSGKSRHPLRFNLSHSHGLALIGISSEREIGIDVERMRPEFAGEEIAKRYFSAKEIAELSQVPAKLRTEGFFLCWTRKEAYIKAKGDGLHIPLDSFDVSLTPGVPPKLNSADHSDWSLRSLEVDRDFAAAIIAEGNSWRLRQFTWVP